MNSFIRFMFFNKRRNRCFILANKYNYEIVKSIIENEGYRLLSTEYVNNKTKLEIECKNGHIYQARFDNFQTGYRCPKCAMLNSGEKRKHSFKYIMDFIKKQNYHLLSHKYVNAKTKLLIKCPNNHTFQISFGHFKNGNRCPYCAKNLKLTYEQVKINIENFNYKLLSTEYKNNNQKLIIECDKRHIFEKSYAKFQEGQHCPICSKINQNKNSALQYEDVKHEIESFNYKLNSTEYKNARSKLKLQCSQGHEFEMTYDKFKQGNRCSICNHSKGEAKINNWLTIHNVHFQTQYVIPNCKYKKPLRFDFAILNNNTIKCLIEFDGEQHYHPKEIFGGSKGLNLTKQRDKIKDNYCKKNNLKLIRIPYTKFDDIEQILEELI